MWERRKKSVLKSARADGDWSRRPPGHATTEAAREEVCFITAEKGRVARAEKEKQCTAECKSQRRLDETAPWALFLWSGERGDDEKQRKPGEQALRGARRSQQAVPKIAREEEH